MKLTKILSSALAAVLLLQGMAAAAGAEKEETYHRSYQAERFINPAWAKMLPEMDGLEAVTGETLLSESQELPKAEVFFTNQEELISQFDKAVKQRQTQFTFGFTYDLYSEMEAAYPDQNPFVVPFHKAIEHDSMDPTGGDYLNYHLMSFGCDFKEPFDEEGISVTYFIQYNSTAEQEEMVDEAVAALVSGWKTKELTGLDAIETIYNYITTSVEYDYDGLAAYGEAANQDALTQEHMEIFTAYAALIEKTAVCQGYATLFYRLALEMGLDARFISGWGFNGTAYESHGWNIVEYNGKYYNIDTTWDAGMLEYGYEYYMTSDADFKDHERHEEFTTETFYAAYPMTTYTIHYTKEANPGEIEFVVPKRTTPWAADGIWFTGEYYRIPTEIGWVSVAVSSGEQYLAAKRLQPFLAMSWDEEYIYTMLQFTDPNGHVNLRGDAPNMMWDSGCVQIGFAEADAVGGDRLEYGVGITSDAAAKKISSVWATNNGDFVPSAEDFGVTMEETEDGTLMVYEFRTPISAFTADDEITVGDKYGVCYNISWGNGDMTWAHTQLGSGISGYAEKAAQNFMHFTLVEDEPDDPDEPTEPDEPDEPTEPDEVPGDLDGDGDFDSDDVAMIADWFAGKTAALGFDPAKADFNKDTQFNRADGMYLARALAGWENYTLS